MFVLEVNILEFFLTPQCCYVIMFALEGNMVCIIFLSPCNVFICKVLLFFIRGNLTCVRFALSSNVVVGNMFVNLH